MWQKLLAVWKHKDLRKKIIYVMGILVIYRFAAQIPIPGIDIGNLQSFFNSNAYLGLLNVFSGGALENFSIVMLGVGPYITASIIFQLLNIVVPKFEEMQKESDGQKKIQQWTRYLTVPLAIAQGTATIIFLRNAGGGTLIGELSLVQWVTAVTVVTAGSVFIMWLGELITEKNVGNGISLMIFAAIVARLPISLQQLFSTYDSTQLPTIVLFLGMSLLMVYGIVFVTEGQRNIPISSARQMRGQQNSNIQNHLPIRVNQAGVIPIIFAIAMVLFPPVVGQFMSELDNATLSDIGFFVVDAFNNQVIYGAIYFTLVFVFTYFYTAVVFKPEQIAENLQRRGSFIQGVRPGKPTSDYLQYVSNHLLLFGAIFLGLVAVLPVAIQAFATGSATSLVVGGTSLLIVVSVGIETVKQVKSQMQVSDYDQF